MATLRAMPVLQVSDMGRSVAFWRCAGFEPTGDWPEDGLGTETIFAILQRGDVTLALQLLRARIPVNTHWAAYAYVDDVEALHAEMTAEGLAPTAINRPDFYGCDDFDIRPDGHLVAFGQAREPVPGPGLSARRGRG